jgi:hypothetical protein
MRYVSIINRRTEESMVEQDGEMSYLARVGRVADIGKILELSAEDTKRLVEDGELETDLNGNPISIKKWW